MADSLFAFGVLLTSLNLFYSLLSFFKKFNEVDRVAGNIHGRKGIEQLGDALADLHQQTEEVTKRADFIALGKQSLLEQKLMGEYEGAVQVLEKREKGLREADNSAYSQQLSQLKSDYQSTIELITTESRNNLKSKEDELNLALSQHKDEINQLVSSHKTEVETLIANHSDELNRIRSDRNAEMHEITTSHSTESSNIKTNHSIEIKTLESNHSDELMQLKEEHETALRSQEEELTTHFAVVLAQVAVESSGRAQKLPDKSIEFNSFIGALLGYARCCQPEDELGELALSAAATLEPCSAQVVHDLASFALKVRKDNIKAIRLLRDYHDKENTEDALRALGSVLDQMGRCDDAAFHFDLAGDPAEEYVPSCGGNKAVKFQPKPLDPDLSNISEGLAALGERLAQSTQFPEAIRAFETVLLLSPLDYGAHLGLSWCYVNTERFQRAIDHAYFALSIDRTSAAMRLLARAYDEAGDHDSAEKYRDMAADEKNTLSMVAESKRKLAEAIAMED